MARTLSGLISSSAVVQSLPNLKKKRLPRRPSELEVQRRRAGEVWNTIGPEFRQEWKAFASKLQRYCPTRRKVVGPSARQAFTLVALQRWHLDPGLDCRTTPPWAPFYGDEIGVLAVERDLVDPVTKGHLRFEANGPNRAGVMTELLIQKLSGPDSTPRPSRFKPIDFVRFTVAQSIYETPLPNGYYATAYRFVNVATLQVSPMYEAGIVRVGKKPKARRPSAREMGRLGSRRETDLFARFAVIETDTE